MITPEHKRSGVDFFIPEEEMERGTGNKDRLFERFVRPNQSLLENYVRKQGKGFTILPIESLLPNGNFVYNEYVDMGSLGKARLIVVYDPIGKYDHTLDKLMPSGFYGRLDLMYSLVSV